MRISLTAQSPQSSTDVVLDCDEAATVADVARALSESVPGATPQLVVAGEEVAGDVLVADAGLLDGMRVGIGTTPAPDPEPSVDGWQLHVVSGPDAGAVYAMPQGVHEVGRSGVVSVLDNAMSRRHCAITVTAEGATVADLGSSNGTRLDGVLLDANAPAPLALGQVVSAGHSALVLRTARASDAVTEGADPGTAHFLRQPRMLPMRLVPEVFVPGAPPEKQNRKIPVIAMVVPALMGVTMALVLKNPMYLLFTLMSPVMLIGNWLSDRRTGARDHKEAVEKYHRDLKTSQTRLAEAVEKEQTRLRSEFPDAAETYLTCVLPGRRLWERRRHDVDHLDLRLGTSDLPSTVKLTGSPDDDVEHRLHSVPVTVSLRSAGVLGVAGEHNEVVGLLRWLLVQLCAYHPTRDLAVTLLTSRAEEHWDWTRWLPHLRTGNPDGSVALVGNDPDTVGAQVSALLTVLEERKRAAKDTSGITAASFPAHVLLVHGYAAMRTTRGMAQILEDGPSVGIYVICADADERLLSERCTATLVWSASRPDYAVLRRTGEMDVPDVLVEGVDRGWCERVARAISPLLDVGGDDDGAMLPDSARLLDIIGLDPPTSDAVRARWALEPRSTVMTIGAGLDGTFALDLTKDGPHGLIAGMTGSGKTELLQTMIASLALANRPDSLNFVLVDYKGDAAFKDCVDLPHTVGKVNDLDPHLVVRALESLQAELTVRKNFLAAAGVKDIEDYQDLQDREPERPSLPRLLLVIDEFAQMIKDLPDFVKGLVGIAQVGRSLGVHLLLATQRPSGAVSPEIRANTNMRISLRVADASDSTDVLNSPDAAQIPKSSPGRGYARLGAGSLLSFQAGRVGGRRPGATQVEAPPPFVAPVAWRQLGYQAPKVPGGGGQEDVKDTDLAGLVSAVRAAAEAENVPPQRQPWLPAMPDHLPIADVYAAYSEAGSGAGLVPGLPIGMRDVPKAQQQEVATFDLVRDGHLLVIGSGGTGRSQVLRAIAAGIASLTSPRDVHLYGLDCGNGALNPLTQMPHCGAVVGRTELERASRLLSRIGAEMDRRQEVLATGGFSDISEQRRSAPDPLAHLVLFLDRWEGFAPVLGDYENGAMTEAVGRILREGASLGVHIVITGDRSLANNRLASAIDNKLVFRLADKMDYSLVGLNARQLPDTMLPGRSFTSTGFETQVLLLDGDEGGQGQAAALAALGQQAAARAGELGASEKPFRLDVLPGRITLDEALELVPTGPGASTPYAVIGVGGDDLTGFTLDLSRPTTFVVGGPGRSGRSTVLANAALSACRSGAQVLAFAPRHSPVRDLAGQPGVLGVFSEVSTPAESYQELLATASGPVLVVVDDADHEKDLPGGAFFTSVLRGEAGTRGQTPMPVSMLAAGNIEGNLFGGFGSWTPDLKQGRSGLLLSPQSFTDGELIGLSGNKMPRSLLGQPVSPGRGLLHLGDGELTRVATLLAPAPVATAEPVSEPAVGPTADSAPEADLAPAAGA